MSTGYKISEQTEWSNPITETLFGYDDRGLSASIRIVVLLHQACSFNNNSYHPATGNLQASGITGGYTMNYGENGQPLHALTSIDGTPANIPSADQTITYTDFKKVKQITEDNNVLNITYGADRQRIRTRLTTPSGTLSRYYIGNYEEEIQNNNTRKIHYISGGNGLAAICVQNHGNDTLYYVHTDYQGSLIALSLPNGLIKERYAYDPWGNRRNPANWTQTDARTSFLIHRGYTMHEHLPEFRLINMNGRVYDPLTMQFFSPDPYLQAPGDWLNYNRYSYCLNNPFKYTDPDGEFIWTIINAVKDFLVNTFVNVWTQGFNAWSNEDNWHSTQMAWKIDLGLFQGDFKQIISRFTWELPQTLLGYTVSSVHNTFGGVKSVSYYGGATAVESYSKDWKGLGLGTTTGFTLGSYINGVRGIEAKPDNKLFQHEYGHYLQSQSSGWFYLSKYAIPSALSSGTHGQNPVEQDANARALTYFNEKYPGFTAWHSSNNINGYKWWLPYGHKDNQLALKQAKLGLSWYDWVMVPFNFSGYIPTIIPGLVNTWIFNSKY